MNKDKVDELVAKGKTALAKGKTVLEEIKSNFKADEGTVGFKKIQSMFSNLWKSGMTGRTAIVASFVILVALICMVVPDVCQICVFTLLIIAVLVSLGCLLVARIRRKSKSDNACIERDLKSDDVVNVMRGDDDSCLPSLILPADARENIILRICIGLILTVGIVGALRDFYICGKLTENPNDDFWACGGEYLVGCILGLALHIVVCMALLGLGQIYKWLKLTVGGVVTGRICWSKGFSILKWAGYVCAIACGVMGILSMFGSDNFIREDLLKFAGMINKGVEIVFAVFEGLYRTHDEQKTVLRVCLCGLFFRLSAYAFVSAEVMRRLSYIYVLSQKVIQGHSKEVCN